MQDDATPPALRILVIDDEPAMREVLEARLGSWGHDVRCADCAGEGRRLALAFDPHVVISDLVLPDQGGVELLRDLKADSPERVVLLITAYATVESAVAAMRLGAADFLTKPIDYAALRSRLAEVAARLPRESAPGVEAADGSGAGDRLFVGKSASTLQLEALVRAAALSDATAFIVGESGTGKELVARTLHRLGARHDGPFIAVNAAAIPEGLGESVLLGHKKGAFTGATDTRGGLFQLAHGGTLFLDELTEMAPSLQAKLLRVLEDGVVRPVGDDREQRFDVRVIAATNRDPEVAVEEGVLRRDLFYRLDVVRLAIAPLRERPADIVPLVHHFVAHFNGRHQTEVEGFSERALGELADAELRGNVRELRNIVERAVVLTRRGRVELLPGQRADATPRDAARFGIVLPEGVTSAEAERILVRETLLRTGNNRMQAARKLGIDVKTLRSKLKTSADEP
jgi:DNA-binding NtrC family response regulator